MEASRSLESVYKLGHTFCYKVNLLVTAWISTRVPSLSLGLGVSNDQAGMEACLEKGIYLKERELEDLKNIVESGHTSRKHTSRKPLDLRGVSAFYGALQRAPKLGLWYYCLIYCCVISKEKKKKEA
jgi:hypothetical protein